MRSNAKTRAQLFPTGLINNHLNMQGHKAINDNRAGSHGNGDDDSDGAEEDGEEEDDADKRSEATNTPARAPHEDERKNEGMDEHSTWIDTQNANWTSDAI